MKPRTTATMARLEAADWFAHVGAPGGDTVLVVPSWEGAFASATSAEWPDVQLEAANRYRERLFDRDRDRFKRWNDVVDEVKPMTMALVTRKLAASRRPEPWPTRFVGAVQWDVLHLAMEDEYHDVVPGSFYTSLGEWYVQGRFPCGWQGDFPEGKLIIY
jgi:hypothetical protein